jgi:tetraacyldisaccharide 4'-kinase
MSLRRHLYAAGLLRTQSAPARVISVGNITVGGTGKTPVVSLLASHLEAEGKHPVILTRGYGRRSSEMVFLPTQGAGWEQAGDEPLMLSRELSQVPIVVHHDRVWAAKLAWERYHPQVFLLDDGMQHLRIARDLEILVIDVTRPPQRDRVFPADHLRENRRSLRYADLYLLTRTDQSPDIEELSTYLRTCNPSAIQVRTIFRPWALRALPTGDRRAPESLRDRTILAFSGIGHPGSLEHTLTGLGIRLAGRLHFPDHYPYTPEDVDLIERRATQLGAQAIVTTEKDAVRLRFIDRRSVPFFSLMVRIEITSGAEDFWRLVTKEY